MLSTLIKLLGVLEQSGVVHGINIWLSGILVAWSESQTRFQVSIVWGVFTLVYASEVSSYSGIIFESHKINYCWILYNFSLSVT